MNNSPGPTTEGPAARDTIAGHDILQYTVSPVVYPAVLPKVRHHEPRDLRAVARLRARSPQQLRLSKCGTRQGQPRARSSARVLPDDHGVGNDNDNDDDADEDDDDDDEEEVEVEDHDEENEDAGVETRNSGGAAREPRPRRAWRCARWSTVPWCPRG